jgi:hypothetical protein
VAARPSRSHRATRPIDSCRDFLNVIESEFLPALAVHPSVGWSERDRARVGSPTAATDEAVHTEREAAYFVSPASSGAEYLTLCRED